jgi:hypothetical protein
LIYMITNSKVDTCYFFISENISSSITEKLVPRE